MNWRELLLGDCFKIKHGYAFKGEYFSDAGRHVVLTPGNFHELGGFRARPGKDRYYSIDPPDDFILEPNDLVIAMTEQGEGLLGSSALIPSEGVFLHNQRIGLIEELNEARLDKLFLYHLFNTPFVRGKIRASATGGKVRHTAPKRIYEIRLLVPEVRQQRKIAETISAYDDLIENNRRRIALLEEAARMLYREWFVHFRFPGNEHTNIVDGLPQGWELATYGDLFEFQNGFAFKSSTYTDDGRYGVVTIKNVHDARFVSECSSRISAAPEKMGKHCILTSGDILLSLTGNVGRACIVFGENYLLNQRVAKISGKNGVSPQFAYWTFSNRKTQAFLENLAYGVAQLNLSPILLAAQPIVRPPDLLVELFSTSTKAIMEQIVTLNLSIAQLARARGLLLPRLMNGEITV